MARAAGNSRFYTFVLRNENTGRYLKDVVIELPSSTTIIGETLAKPFLVPWAYKVTRDNIAGLAAALVENLEAIGEDDTVLDILTDADILEEYLKENKLRPDDIKEEKGDRGTKAHGLLETLSDRVLHDDDGAAFDMATQALDSDERTVAAVAAWFLAESPMVVASEKVLPCPQLGFCGTTDLIWYDESMTKVVTDLKTRRADLPVYESDQFQVDSYFIAHNLMYPEAPCTRRTVLLARDDGTWYMEDVSVPEGSFMRLKDVWDILQRGGR